MTRRATLLFALLASFTLANAAPEPPEAYLEGEKLFADGDHAGAEAKFLDALADDPRWWPAREGLARALHAQGRVADALPFWRQALLHADRDQDLDIQKVARHNAARTALAGIDPATQQLHTLMSIAAKDLVKYATSKGKRKPDKADALLRRVLRMDPTCGAAHGALAKHKRLPWGAWVPQYTGSLDDWGGLNSAEWTNVDENTLGLDASQSGFQAQTDHAFSGDFDFRAQIQVRKRAGAAWAMGVVATMKDSYDSVTWGVSQDQVFLSIKRGEDDKRQPFYNMRADNLQPPVDLAKPNEFELRLRGDRIIGLVNGREIVSTRRAFHRVYSHMGVMATLASVTFSHMAARQR